jgi:hypothetical protein
LRVSGASEPGSPDVANEDWWGATSRVVVVLDGVTVPAGMETGCRHGTPWYVWQLGTRILQDAEAGEPLDDALWHAIERVAHAHRRTCDLNSAGAPSAAAAILRIGGDAAEYLVLADVTIALQADGKTRVVTDDRVGASVASVDPQAADVGEQIARRRAADRNRPGGYWVAAADPDAAGHAVTGTVAFPRRRTGSSRWAGRARAVVMTDGAARAATMFGVAWNDVLGWDPAGLIAEVRLAEAGDRECMRWPRFKVSDDATAVTWRE